MASPLDNKDFLLPPRSTLKKSSKKQSSKLEQMPQLKLDLTNDEEADIYDNYDSARGNRLLIQSSSVGTSPGSHRNQTDREEWRLYAQTQELARKANKLFQEAMGESQTSLPGSQARSRMKNHLMPPEGPTQGSKLDRYGYESGSNSSRSVHQVRKHVEIVEERHTTD